MLNGLNNIVNFLNGGYIWGEMLVLIVNCKVCNVV